VRHRLRAWLAKLALRLLQFLGVEVCVLSWAERKELATVRCSVISLPFRCESLHLRASGQGAGEAPPLDPSRPYSLVFLGRPVVQKGWPRFIDLVKRIGGRSVALVPCLPEGPIPPQLEVRVNATDEEVRAQLRHCRILFLPADYESFGFAQAEALQQGCCVPVLGEWPLWIGCLELDWRQASPLEQAIRIESLLHDEPRRKLLVLRQQQHWEHRSERREAVLPKPLLPGFQEYGDTRT
jgi:glycosyltransferase involved in cell wall biosynthesis